VRAHSVVGDIFAVDSLETAILMAMLPRLGSQRWQIVPAYLVVGDSVRNGSGASERCGTASRLCN